MSKIARYYHLGIVYFSVTLGSLLTASSLLALLLGSLTGWLFGRALEVALTGLCIPWLLGSIGWMVVSRFRAGPVLLDIKAIHPKRGWLIAAAIGYLFVLSPDFDFENVARSLRSQTVFLLLVVYFISFARGRCQVRKGGVWLYVTLLPWHKIKSYTLQDAIFYFRTDGLELWEKKGYDVPEEHVGAFERYLQEHGVPNSTAAAVAPA